MYSTENFSIYEVDGEEHKVRLQSPLHTHPDSKD